MVEVIQYIPAVESIPLTLMKKKKRNLPGTPDPDAEVIALSPQTLMATNRYVCEVCGKGFQRDQNLQLHRRGHNLPWKLKLRTTKEVMKRVYVCPEKSCLHHNPTRALGDLTGIKKHFCRKHGEKKWKCEKCCKTYAVRSDWRAHSKICGTREYKCSCGTLFSRRDSFVTHRAFCDALAEETARVHAAANYNSSISIDNCYNYFMGINQLPPYSSAMMDQCSSFFQPPQLEPQLITPVPGQIHQQYSSSLISGSNPYLTNNIPFVSATANFSAAALLQKASFIRSTTSKTDEIDLTKLCGIYEAEATGGTFTSSVKVVVSDVEDSENTTCNNINNFCHSQYFPVAERQRTAPSKDSVSDCPGGRTLDFLGVGVPSFCQPSSINGLF